MNGNACPLLSGLEQQAKDNGKRDRLWNTPSAVLFIWPHAGHHGWVGVGAPAQPSLCTRTTSFPSLSGSQADI